MQFINIRELSRSPSKYVKEANENDDVVITRNGHPVAILTKIDEENLEDYIIAKHYHVEKDFAGAVQEHESGTTTTARDLLDSMNG